MTNEVIEEHTADLRGLYESVVDEEAEKERAERFTHSQLVGELGKEVERLKAEVSSVTVIYLATDKMPCMSGHYYNILYLNLRVVDTRTCMHAHTHTLISCVGSH